MIPNGEGWHYLPVENFLALLTGITSKYGGDVYCLDCFHLFRTGSKLELLKVCENKDFCNAVMPSEDTKILKFNQDYKSD